MKNKYLAYCGLYCRLCDAIARVPPQSAALLETLKRGGWEQFGDILYPNFRQFWEVLEELCNFEEKRGACLGGCGDPSCKIRACAQKRGIDLCSTCSEYPCDLILELANRYPMILENGKEQKEMGLEAWLSKQEELFRSGFAYGDVISNGEETAK